MKPHFLLSDVTLKKRDVKKHKNIIDVTTLDSMPYKETIIRKEKSEEIKVELTLVSCGKTTDIDSFDIIKFIFEKLGNKIK